MPGHSGSSASSISIIKHSLGLADGDIQVVDSVSGRDGTDTLTNIDAQKFNDGTSVDLTSGHLPKFHLTGTTGNDLIIAGRHPSRS